MAVMCRRWPRSSAAVLAAIGLLLLVVLVQAQEKTAFKEQGGEKEKGKAAGAENEEEDFVPEHEEVEEELGPFQIKRPKYKLVEDFEDPNYFGTLGVKRLASIPDVRKAFREQARKYRDVIMKCNHPECFAKTNVSTVNATGIATNATANATGANGTAANGRSTMQDPKGRGKVEAKADAKRGTEESNQGLPKMSKKAWTPTLNGFKPLTEAYRVLSDPLRKRVYEVSGKRGLDGKYKPHFQDPLREPYKLEMAFKTGSFKMDFGFKEGQSKNTGVFDL